MRRFTAARYCSSLLKQPAGVFSCKYGLRIGAAMMSRRMMGYSGPDPYQVLGVPKTASHDEIKKAYKKMAMKHHPDVSKEPDAKDQFTKAGEAYKILSDPQLRKQYDSGTFHPQQGSQQQQHQQYQQPGSGPGQSSGYYQQEFTQWGPGQGGSRRVKVTRLTPEEAERMFAEMFGNINQQQRGPFGASPFGNLGGNPLDQVFGNRGTPFGLPRQQQPFGQQGGGGADQQGERASWENMNPQQQQFGRTPGSNPFGPGSTPFGRWFSYQGSPFHILFVFLFLSIVLTWFVNTFPNLSLALLVFYLVRRLSRPF